MEVKDKIVEGAKRLFFQYGVRSVSMDDVARELAMSKKTLYQFFTNKDELVTAASMLAMEEEKNAFRGIPEKAENAVHELFLLSFCMRETINHIHPSLIYDLKKYHPEGWQVFQDFKYDFIKGSVLANIKRGKEEGNYRKELHSEIIATLRVETVQLVFDGVFSNIDVPFGQIQVQLFEHFAFGLMTEQGNKRFQDYLNDMAIRSENGKMK